FQPAAPRANGRTRVPEHNPPGHLPIHGPFSPPRSAAPEPLPAHPPSPPRPCLRRPLQSAQSSTTQAIHRRQQATPRQLEHFPSPTDRCAPLPRQLAKSPKHQSEVGQSSATCSHSTAAESAPAPEPQPPNRRSTLPQVPSRQKSPSCHHSAAPLDTT